MNREDEMRLGDSRGTRAAHGARGVAPRARIRRSPSRADSSGTAYSANFRASMAISIVATPSGNSPRTAAAAHRSFSSRYSGSCVMR